MTKRVSITQAELTRAIRAAEACGKVVVWTPRGIIFAEAGEVALPSPDLSEADECDKAFGVGR